MKCVLMYFGIILFLISNVSASIQPAAITSIPNSMVAYYKCDSETIYLKDETSYDHRGNLINYDTIQLYQEGVYGQALKFDGSNDYVRITQTSALNFTKFSFTIWVNFSEVSLSEYYAICNKYITTPPYSSWTLTMSKGRLRLQIADEVTYRDIFYNMSSFIQTKKWYHFGGVYDGSSAKLYVNGTLVGQISMGILQNSPEDLRIGALYNGAAHIYYLNGSIDEFVLFNTALSDQEINAIYNGEFPISDDDDDDNDESEKTENLLGWIILAIIISSIIIIGVGISIFFYKRHNLMERNKEVVLIKKATSPVSTNKSKPSTSADKSKPTTTTVKSKPSTTAEKSKPISTTDKPKLTKPSEKDIKTKNP